MKASPYKRTDDDRRKGPVWDQARARATFGGTPDPLWYQAAEGEVPPDWSVNEAIDDLATESGWDAQCGSTPAEFLREKAKREDANRAQDYADKIRSDWRTTRASQINAFTEALETKDFAYATQILQDMRLAVIRHGSGNDMKELDIFARILAAVQKA